MDKSTPQIAQLDALAGDLMERTGVPGMTVAVVRTDRKVYAKGFGTPEVVARGFRIPYSSSPRIEACVSPFLRTRGQREAMRFIFSMTSVPAFSASVPVRLWPEPVEKKINKRSYFRRNVSVRQIHGVDVPLQ
jgi:hypothetical protein